jgi:hypothetical protein
MHTRRPSILPPATRNTLRLTDIGRNVAARVAENDGMDTDLTAIKAVLANISDTGLTALIAAKCGVMQTAPDLLAWIAASCDWGGIVALDSSMSYSRPRLRSERQVPSGSMLASGSARCQEWVDSSHSPTPAVRLLSA